MAINFSSRDEHDVLVDINTTPLIDVMLVLLIMLIITIPMQTHAVKLDMPQANAAPSNIKPQVVRDRHRLRRHAAVERHGRARPARRWKRS